MYGSGMAGLYMEDCCQVTVDGCVFDANYVALSVWGGYTQERIFKTQVYDEYQSDDVSCRFLSSCQGLAPAQSNCDPTLLWLAL